MNDPGPHEIVDAIGNDVCLPERGSLFKVLGFNTAFEHELHVKVVSGTCKGSTGYMNDEMVEPIPPPQPLSTETEVVLFTPWSSSGLRHGFTVSGNVKGSCWIHFLASERPDAWRCMAGDDIDDPCFVSSSDGRTLACAEGPFSKRVTLMTVAKPLADKSNLQGSFGDFAFGARLGTSPCRAATRASSLRERRTPSGVSA